MIALVALYGLFLQPAWKTYKFFSVPGRLGKVKRKRMYTTLALLGVVLAGLFFIPLPAAVYCPLVVQPRRAESVHVEVLGTLVAAHVKPGERVEAGEPLAQLRSIEIDVQIAEQEGIVKRYLAQLRTRERLQHEDDAAGREAATIRENLATAVQQLALLEKDRGRLQLVAPRAGVVVPPPLIPDQKRGGGELGQWSGTPLDKENIGATLSPGERSLFCKIGDPDELEALLAIDQADIDFVRSGDEVELILEQDLDRGVILKGSISEIEPEEMKVPPRQLTAQAGGPLATEIDETGVTRPLDPTYQRTVPIDDPTGELRPGLIGTAKIHTAPRTLASRLWRYLSATFSFEL
jgi:putative peptide zinc metalloprotease protein